MQALNIKSLTQVNFSPLSRRYSLEEFWALPEREDHAHYNLIAGILFIVPPPEPPHGDLVSQMARYLHRFLLKNEVASCVYFPPEPIYQADNLTYLEPDLFYVSSKQIRVDPSTADIVFEVLSASTSIYDRTTKADTYLALAVSELWLIDSFAGMVEVRHASKADETPVWEICTYAYGQHAKSRVLDGFEVSVDEIFKDITR